MYSSFAPFQQRPFPLPPAQLLSTMHLVSDHSRRHFQVRKPDHYRGRQQRAIVPAIRTSKHAHLPPLPKAELPVLCRERGRISSAAVDCATREPSAVDIHSGAGPIVQWFKRGSCCYLCLPWSPGGRLGFVLFSGLSFFHVVGKQRSGQGKSLKQC